MYCKRKKKENALLCIYDTLGVKLLPRLRLQFSHLNEHKFRLGFSNTINPMGACGTESETAEHFPFALLILQYPKIKSLIKLNQIF